VLLIVTASGRYSYHWAFKRLMEGFGIGGDEPYLFSWVCRKAFFYSGRETKGF
jgi:hypothetical protein